MIICSLQTMELFIINTFTTCKSTIKRQCKANDKVKLKYKQKTNPKLEQGKRLLLGTV